MGFWSPAFECIQRLLWDLRREALLPSSIFFKRGLTPAKLPQSCYEHQTLVICCVVDDFPLLSPAQEGPPPDLSLVDGDIQVCPDCSFNHSSISSLPDTVLKIGYVLIYETLNTAL